MGIIISCLDLDFPKDFPKENEKKHIIYERVIIIEHEEEESYESYDECSNDCLTDDEDNNKYLSCF